MFTTRGQRLTRHERNSGERSQVFDQQEVPLTIGFGRRVISLLNVQLMHPWLEARLGAAWVRSARR